MKHFVIYRTDFPGPSTAEECYATTFAAQKGLDALGYPTNGGCIRKVPDGEKCAACGAVADDGLEAEIV